LKRSVRRPWVLKAYAKILSANGSRDGFHQMAAFLSFDRVAGNRQDAFERMATAYEKMMQPGAHRKTPQWDKIARSLLRLANFAGDTDTIIASALEWGARYLDEGHSPTSVFHYRLPAAARTSPNVTDFDNCLSLISELTTTMRESGDRPTKTLGALSEVPEAGT